MAYITMKWVYHELADSRCVLFWDAQHPHLRVPASVDSVRCPRTAAPVPVGDTFGWTSSGMVPQHLSMDASLIQYSG